MDFKFIWNKKLIIECNILFIAIVLSIVLLATGIASPFIYCFAVDNQEIIYVGLQNEIQVYNKNQHIQSISPQTSRSYMFTIVSGNTILLSNANTVYSMDLDGNVLSSREDPGADTYNQMQYKKHQFTTLNGDIYKIISPWGMTRIVKNNSEIVYQISIISFIVKIMIYISFLGCFIVPAANIIKHKKHRKKTD